MSRPTRGLIGAVALVLLAGCATGPREVHLGSDACDHCHMTLTDDRFSAQLVTTRGRSHVFDSIECMAEFLADGGSIADERVGSLWVTHLPEPGRWVDATEAVFLRSENLRSPMGMNLSAFADRAALEEYRRELGGDVLAWQDVTDLVRRAGVGPDGVGHGH